MNSVMVGMFDTLAAAETAKRKLLDSGFLASAVVVSSGVQGAQASTVGSTVHANHVEEEGAISRFFHSIFGSDDERDDDTYREAIRRGNFGVSVTTNSDEQTNLAESVLEGSGAFNVDERSQQWRNDGWTGRDVAATDKTLVGDAKQTLKLVEEDLKVGKRSVARGGVRVFSKIVTRPVEETVHLREEHASVQRRQVDRPATEADFAAFKEGSVEVREMAEEAVISKEARVVGEVDIGKTVTERDQTVRDTVRETKVEVEKFGSSAPGTMPAAGVKPNIDR